MSLQTTFATESRKINFVATDRQDVTAKKDVSGNQDVFSQVFSDIQRMDKVFGATEIKKDEVRASDIDKPKAERKDCADKLTRKEDVRSTDCNDDDDKNMSDVHEDDERADIPQRTEECQGKVTDNDDKSEKKPEPETPVAAKPDEPVSKKTLDPTDGTETRIEAETLDFSDIVVTESGAEPTSEQKAQTQIPAVLIAPAQDAKTGSPQKIGAETQNPQQTMTHEEAAQLKTISFRADPSANDDKAGKGNAVAQSADTQQVAADVAPVATQELKIKDAAQPTHTKTAITQDAKGAENGVTAPSLVEDSENARQLNALVRDAVIEKKDLRLASSQENDAAQDQPVSHPAAGTRVIAPMGFSAPPSSNGLSGGGSLPSQQTVKGEAAQQPQAIAVDGVRAASSHEAPSLATLARARESMPSSNLQPSEQVAVQLHRMAKTGTDRFDMQLHPAELGRVDVRMEISKDGVVQVTITADNQAAYDMLQKDQRGLERALQQAGLQTDSGSLSFNLRGGEANSQQQREAQNSRGGNGGNNGNERQGQAANDDVATTANYTVAPGRVDVRV